MFKQIIIIIDMIIIISIIIIIIIMIMMIMIIIITIIIIILLLLLLFSVLVYTADFFFNTQMVLHPHNYLWELWSLHIHLDVPLRSSSQSRLCISGLDEESTHKNRPGARSFKTAAGPKAPE